MKRKKRITGILLTAVLLLMMLLPVSEADAETSASDFRMEGSTLIKYRGTGKNVTIPSTVEVIGKSAFEDNTNIELVVVPNSVKRIEAYAFWGCDNLDTVVLGKGLSEVGDYSFAGCKGLVQMSVPSTVSSIGIEAFADCENLKDISIPPETQYIHETAFDGCVNLTIHAETGSAAEQYAKDFYERQKKMPGYEDNADSQPSDPSQGTETPVTPPVPGPADPVPTQPPAEIQGDVLSSTHIVGNKAVFFVNNTRLPVYGNDRRQEPSAPSESPAGDAGRGDSIPKFRIVDGRIIADQAYYRSRNLRDISLPDGIEEVGQFAFARSSVTSAVLPAGVKEIAYGAFYHCDNLEEVTLPDTVMSVEPKAFEHTLWVENFLKEGSGVTAAAGSTASSGNAAAGSAVGDFLTTGGVLIAYRGNAAEVTVPSDVRVIAAEVFKDHTEIESVILPDSLQVVGEGAFEGCTGLARLDFGKSVEEIKDRAFLGNVLGDVTLPASLKKIGLQAFGNAILTYGSGETERTYEDSASRLSNEAYRVYDRVDTETPGVTVKGLEETFGSGAGISPEEAVSLEGAARSYTLTVAKAEDSSAMEKAFQRAFQTAIPENMYICELTLTDTSGVPLTNLGSQALTVTFPVPESLRGQSLALYTLDRNGQLEVLPVESVSVDGVEAFRFQMDYVSVIGVCGH